MVHSKWFNMKKFGIGIMEGETRRELRFSSRIHLRVCLEGAYHVMDESTMYISDQRPTARQLWKPPVGILEVGILGVKELLPMKMRVEEEPLMPTALLMNQLDSLRYQAMNIVAARLGRVEPPLRKEVVEYMLDVESHMWSMRRSKANFFRIMAPLSGLINVFKWFGEVRHWKNPITTVLVHVLLLILVWYPKLILPTVFLYMFMIGLWNFRIGPRYPPHMKTQTGLPCRPSKYNMQPIFGDTSSTASSRPSESPTTTPPLRAWSTTAASSWSR
ncbi:hypothetical protein Cni_G02650 [Canna indica]|uniref:Phosphoribosylanthranilate transferase n=1 Tax=Canna indica TaxID=4628 RepID=A0AAQ3JPL3_9LILI|nr:hypothetical protein Cni_G02650 [Canna indica]